jgi:hypothetical protein
MATPNELLAASLDVLRDLQKDGRRVFQSKEISRVHRERLVHQGFLKEVIKGWLISSSPGTAKGDSTPWYASFWEFCARYCDSRFGDQWHLSAEQSILLLAENTTIPKQVIVYSPNGTNNTINLLFDTSLYDLKARMPAREDLAQRDGLQLFSAGAALVRVPEKFFSRYPIEVRVVLTSVKDASEVLTQLLQEGRSVVAGRLAGAFRRIERQEIADEIISTMKSAGYSIRESDPFTAEQKFGALVFSVPPIVNRLHAMWENSRKKVIDNFPKAPGLPKDRAGYLDFVDDIYKSDAYHSLSIEGYSVTPELIERVRSGSWKPDSDATDAETRNALAARGYWQAFQRVKESVTEVIQGRPSGEAIRAGHRDWYRELFQPCVAAGIIPATALAGYRRHPVFLRASRYVPPRSDIVPDAMSALFDLLDNEPEAGVRAVLGHWLLGFIHPYPDGNGRMARFLMNVALASGGYPWTVIRVEDRDEYLRALDLASIDGDVVPFSKYIASRVRWSEKKVERERRAGGYQ